MAKNDNIRMILTLTAGQLLDVNHEKSNDLCGRLLKCLLNDFYNAGDYSLVGNEGSESLRFELDVVAPNRTISDMAT